MVEAACAGKVRKCGKLEKQKVRCLQMREPGEQTSVIPTVCLQELIFEQFKIYQGTTKADGETSQSGALCLKK